jgi:hypothetical protein
LQARSGCRITVVPDSQADLSSPERPIHLTGDDSAITTAKGMIETIVSSGSSRVCPFDFD